MNLLGGPDSANRMSSRQNAESSGKNFGIKYPSPFFDLAQQFLPTDVHQLHQWCRYYFLTNPIIHAGVSKMAEYPVTPIIFETTDARHRLLYEGVEEQLKLREFQVEVGLDYFCLQGDTLVTTEQGPRRIRDLTGQTVRVLSRGGVYREAAFKSYGTQRLYRVRYGRGEEVLATAEHRWPTRNNGRDVWKTTATLSSADSLIRTVAPRPSKDEDYLRGVRWGVTFGDGTLSNEGRQAHIILYRAGKKQELARFFTGHYTVTPHHAEEYLGIYGLPPKYKTLPPADESASFWYGFVSGFLATDGSVTEKGGETTLTQKNEEVLQAIRAQLPRIGMVGGNVRSGLSKSSFSDEPFRMHYLMLRRSSMDVAEDFIRSDQEAAFRRSPAASEKYAGVHSVEPTDMEEEVFCCVEPETHTFVIDNGVLTGNCYGSALVSNYYPFIKYLVCPRCRSRYQASKSRSLYRWRDFRFELNCPKCREQVKAEETDVYIRSIRDVRLIRWNPENIEIKHNDITGQDRFFYKVPRAMVNDVTLGDPDVIETLPADFTDAIRQNRALRFSPDNIFHLKRPTLAQKDQGWGMPLLYSVLKSAFQMQILNKSQEAIASEHIVPMRVLFPQPSSGGNEGAFGSFNLQNWKAKVESEVNAWKRDPNYIPVLPMPMGYQQIGGQGKQMLLFQEIRAFAEVILGGMGIPAEFIYGGLSYSGSNTSLRALENMFDGYNRSRLSLVKNFIFGNIAAYMRWPKVGVRFDRFKMADDLQRSMFYLQLNQAQKVSDRRLHEELGEDTDKQTKQIGEELRAQLDVQRLTQVAAADVQGEALLHTSRYQAKAMALQTAAQGMAELGVQGAAQQPGTDPLANVNAQPGQMSLGGPRSPQAAGQQPGAAQGLPEGTTTYAENAQAPSGKVPAALAGVQSPLNIGQGGVDLRYIAQRAKAAFDTIAEEQGEEAKQQALLTLSSQNPQLYKLVMVLEQSSSGSQLDPLNAMKAPMPAGGSQRGLGRELG